ncbi:MAG TPA: glycosyltransferase, partial [Bryobacteraceae bacterium]|nr:glycosyltransferase [Bryobacteraceae bacterium]
MRIAHVIWCLRTGGSECLTIDLANAQSRSDQVSVLVVNDDADTTLTAALEPQVRLVRIGRRPGDVAVWPFVRLNALILSLRPHVLHFHNASLASVIGVPVRKHVLTLHHSYTSSDHLRRFDTVVAISEGVRQSLPVNRCGSVSVVHNGIAFQRIRVRETPPRRIQRIVQIGNLNHNVKGQDVLLRAIAKLGDAFTGTVDFIGGGASPEFLRGLATELNLLKRVRFLGVMPRSYVYENLQRYDLLVHPARSEGFGLVIAEAMGAGVPILTSSLAGPMEVIGSGRHGFHFTPGNVEECAQSLSELSRRVQ